SFDGLLTMLGYQDGALDIRRAGHFLKRLAMVGGGAVLLVDHSSEKEGSGKDPRDQMGSSAKKQFIDGLLMFARALAAWRPYRNCQTIIEVGKDRHSKAKANAIFERDNAAWGRIALLHMSPGVLEGLPSTLSLEPPPTYEDVPYAASTVDITEIENRIIDYLRRKKGEWCSKTIVLKTA